MAVASRVEGLARDEVAARVGSHTHVAQMVVVQVDQCLGGLW